MAYYATSNVNHNGVEYTPGQEVKDLTPEQAEALMQFNAVSESKPKGDEAEVVIPGVTPAAVAPIDHPAQDWKEQLPPSEIAPPLEVAAAEQPQVSEQPAEQSQQSEVPPAPISVPVSIKVEPLK